VGRARRAVRVAPATPTLVARGAIARVRVAPDNGGSEGNGSGVCGERRNRARAISACDVLLRYGVKRRTEQARRTNVDVLRLYDA
jgi:hypothetical protein